MCIHTSFDDDNTFNFYVCLAANCPTGGVQITVELCIIRQTSANVLPKMSFANPIANHCFFSLKRTQKRTKKQCISGTPASFGLDIQYLGGKPNVKSQSLGEYPMVPCLSRPEISRTFSRPGSQDAFGTRAAILKENWCSDPAVLQETGSTRINSDESGFSVISWWCTLW